MFRNPRENATLNPSESIRPSTGRPPTPPADARKKPTQSPYFASASSASKSSNPPAAMSKPLASSRQPAQTSKLAFAKRTKGNQSILNFFGKADKSEAGDKEVQEDAPLFFKDAQPVGKQPARATSSRSQSRTTESQAEKFNEDQGPVKRRRLDEHDDFIRTPSPQPQPIQDQETIPSHSSDTTRRPKAPKHRGGPFDDSSSDESGDDGDGNNGDGNGDGDGDNDIRDRDPEPAGGENDVGTMDQEAINAIDEHVDEIRSTVPLNEDAPLAELDSDRNPQQLEGPEIVPQLTRENTSVFVPGEFDDSEDFENEELFEGGEELMERRWMEEQREMEMGLDYDSKSESGDESIRTPRSIAGLDEAVEGEVEEGLTFCPICNGNMKGLSEAEASSHVNACLDGTAAPLPKAEEARYLNSTESPSTPAAPVSDTPVPKRFQRAAVARPAQANPFEVSGDKKTEKSAFSRLMSGHAEDAAWAEAASEEVKSRGKPAYQRTCPFYKIMPGFYICVDAFRYGKVEGQNAYFLSHFHSDHYIGLTSSWCHGPIYASKVTCNLMLQQLKVDPVWVVPLEFEKRVEVPNTKGVFVTMIPANHCPGSSLYLFEKVIGKNRDGSDKMTRILHCGDFRACPAHVQHPLLRPNVIDSLTGQSKQQVIDTCYLDTTYLTPKYSFPSQSDVIDACAQMCVSLSKEIVDSGDSWERAKAERAGSTMAKFLEKGEASISDKGGEEDPKPKKRGRLLVVIGTYSIGKERICLGIAKALNSKIYAPPAKMRICACLEDPELNQRLTKDPLEAQVHMQTLMEIRAETLLDYMQSYKGHFARVVGFRPTGWSYRPPTSRSTENPAVQTVLHSEGWKTRFSMRDLAPQRGSTRESNCFGVPYSEHSSFRELTMFCCALRINRIVPTVNVGSPKSREKMKAWIEKWDAEKRKNGLFKVETENGGWGSGDGKLETLHYGV